MAPGSLRVLAGEVEGSIDLSGESSRPGRVGVGSGVGTGVRDIAIAPRGVSSAGHVGPLSGVAVPFVDAESFDDVQVSGGSPAPRSAADDGGAGPDEDAALGPLVVGLGSPDRGDDAVGPVVARLVADLGLPGVRVLAHEDPTDLVTSMTGASDVVVVDAVWSPGSEPGSLIILETGDGAPPLPEDAWARTGRGGTHAFGLAAAVELARALRRLPPRVTLIGIAAAGFEHGEPLSPAVAAAVERAVAAVRETLGR